MSLISHSDFFQVYMKICLCMYYCSYEWATLTSIVAHKGICAVWQYKDYHTTPQSAVCVLTAEKSNLPLLIKADFDVFHPLIPKWGFCCLRWQDVIFGAISSDCLLTHHSRSSQSGAWVIGRERSSQLDIYCSCNMVFDRGEERRFCTAGSSILKLICPTKTSHSSIVMIHFYNEMDVRLEETESHMLGMIDDKHYWWILNSSVINID